MDNGFIVLHRKVLKSAVATDPHALAIWVRLLLEANWDDRQLMNGTVIQRGELVIGEKKFAGDCGVGRTRLRRVLAQLESLGCISRKPNNKGTHVTICKYRVYQDRDRQTEHQPNIKQTSTEHPPNTEEQSNNKNKGTRGRARQKFVPPSMGEVIAFWEENDLDGDPGAFHDHFTSNGWLVGGRTPMKDWRASARNWSRNDKKFGWKSKARGDDAAAQVAAELDEMKGRTNGKPGTHRADQPLLRHVR